MTVTHNRNIASYLKAVNAIAATTVLAGSGDDADPKDGITIDRDDFDQLYLSALLAVLVTTASLGPATATLELSFNDSVDGITFAPYGDAIDDVVYSTDGDFSVEVPINLAGARRYVRVEWEVTLSASSVDTADVSAALVLGGFDELPTSQTVGGS
jgi:hypothetical protein